MNRLGILSGLLLCCSYSIAQPQPQAITIYNNPSQGVLTESRVFSYLQSQLTQFEITQSDASVDRALKNIAGGEGECVRNLVVNKARSKTLLFSEPTTYFLGLQVFAAPSAQLSSAQTEQNLEALLTSHPKWLLGVEKERSYGDIADAMIQQTPPDQLYVKEGSENEAQMYSMLMSKRFELLLEYPSVITYHAKDASEKPVPIAISGFAPFITGHIACWDTPVTRGFLAAVNSVLAGLTVDERFINWHLEFIDKSLHDTFKQQFSQAQSSRL
ncbi:hypothetical protein L3V43_10540 [Pseudoalteromonas sp. L23]|uniref:hypothetical protein n=1 Tax=Pseudoalteromonas TaxID=53246 RepID=UPI001F20CC67|nr:MULTISPECIES: hypothetical protein [unclassified Pseudoalteromonas]MCF2826826.1 hypothetical protein [Pseudoalteromonas sp. OF5H-5]MCF2832537.1 hypothetical protein [Pseudoalteromonas sp. DL2-H6]MCF2924045.1 hypothetical protein [Pseudoalteromonas sp. DL2-H1]MCF7514155.1 hypothetical protein [Pseudoalteromonas sp. L7]MCF7526091.1 hypothetical protein [Pseudoalteromonas sp. L23]